MISMFLIHNTTLDVVGERLKNEVGVYVWEAMVYILEYKYIINF